MLIKLAWGLKQMPWENEKNMSSFSYFQTKIWLKSYWRATKFLVVVNNFLTKSLSFSRIQWACCCHFSGVSASNHMQIWPKRKYQRKPYLNRCIFSMVSTVVFYVPKGTLGGIRGSSNKEWDFFYSAVNLHARVMKSRLKLARLFGCSQEPYLMCYIVPTFVARQHKKTRQTSLDGSV